MIEQPITVVILGYSKTRPEPNAYHVDEIRGYAPFVEYGGGSRRKVRVGEWLTEIQAEALGTEVELRVRPYREMRHD